MVVHMVVPEVHRVVLMAINNKKAFTISEMLITLMIIGILGVILAPIITHMMPDQNKVMFKRSYYLITNTVAKMLDDDSLYSPFGAVGSGNETTPIYVGFDNTNSVTYNGVTCSGTTKFACLFSEIAGTKSIETEEFSTLFDGSAYSGSASVLYAKDNIKWRFNNPSSGNLAAVITVDVNGDKGPNCYQGDTVACPSRTKGFDRYVVGVYNDGRVKISSGDEWVRSIINASSSVGID